MASYFKRGKTWYYSIDIGVDKDGKRIKQSRGGFTKKKDAESAVAELKIELNNGSFAREAKITFRDFSQSWMEFYKTQVKISSVRARQVELNLVYKYFDGIILKDISRKQYQDMLIDLYNKKYSSNTLKGIHVLCRMIFKRGMEVEAIKKNPTDYARIPKKIEIKDDIPKYMEKEQLKTFLSTAKSYGKYADYQAFLLLAYSGMRGGELCALQWEDVDFTNNKININKTYFNPNNNAKKFELLPPKTPTSKRIIDIDSEVMQEIGKLPRRSDFVFTARKYKNLPIGLRLLDYRFKELLHQSGIGLDLTPHSLRHTHTSLLAEAGVGLEEIMDRLGHADDSTTRKVYLHVTQKMKKEATQKFTTLMGRLQ